MKKGFTLIEILIVITIVSILAVLAISSYGAIRQQARLDIAVDSFISSIKEQTGKVKSGQDIHGAFNSESDSLQYSCFGFALSKNKGPLFQTFIVPYVAVSGNRAHFCDVQSAKAQSFPAELLQDLELTDIKLNDSGVDEVAIFFKPPSGKVDRTLLLGDASTLTVTIGLHNTDQKRTVLLDLVTGEVRRINPKIAI